MVNLDDYNNEKECFYKGEHYIVRDNGAIMRLSREGKRSRKLDNEWTFGVKNSENGYMIFASSIRVHQVVATAFHGEAPAPNMVVDHIDTNRCNNRPENLRWVTKLENALNNPITRKKIIFICGSVENFLNNPSLMKYSDSRSNTSWMKTVTLEEAAACKRNLDKWAEEDKKFSLGTGNGFNENIYKNNELHNGPIEEDLDEDKPLEEYPGFSSFVAKERSSAVGNEIKEFNNSNLEYEEDLFTESLTPNAIQENWNTPSTFPLCPNKPHNMEGYFASLAVSSVVSESIYGKSLVIERAISSTKDVITIVTHNPNSIKPWGLVQIYEKDNKYVHVNCGTFFDQNTALREITKWQGKEWVGEDTIDDLC